MASFQQLVETQNCRILKLTVAVRGSVPQRQLNHALLYVANKGFDEVADILLNIAGADVDAENSIGMTCIMQAAQNGHAAIAKMLIDKGANVRLRSSSGCTALHYAAQYGHYDCAHLVLSAGGDVNAQDNSGNTPVIAAAKNALFGAAVLDLLANRKEAKLNTQNSLGHTALHYVVQQADIISWCGTLLTAGANPNIQDNEGNTPFMRASTEGFDEVMKCLIAFHCDPDIGNCYNKKPIHFLAMKGHYHVIRFMTELNCDFDPHDSKGNIPLFYAVKHNRPEAVKALIRANCKLEPASETGGQNPLETALESQLWGIAKLLVLAGCNVAPLYPWLRRVEAEAEARNRERLTLFEEQREEEEVDQDLQEAVEWFSDWLHKPHSLQQLTRIRIRACISSRTVGKGRLLPIPPALQDYVTLKEVHDHHIEGYKRTWNI